MVPPSAPFTPTATPFTISTQSAFTALHHRTPACTPGAPAIGTGARAYDIPPDDPPPPPE